MHRSIFFGLFFIQLGFFFHANCAEEKFEGSFSAWKEKKHELLSLFLPKRPTILEAGGHHGEETKRLLDLWPEGQVFVFEPNPFAFQELVRNLGSYANVQAYNKALFSIDGKRPFYLCYGTNGNDPVFDRASSLLKPSFEMEIHYQGPIVHVDCISLKSFSQRYPALLIDYMCLNLQGVELAVLESFPEILNQLSCISIHTNLYPFRIGMTQYNKLNEFLEKNGFQMLAHWFLDGLDGEAIYIKKELLGNKDGKTPVTSLSSQRCYEPFFQVYYDIEEDPEDSIKSFLKQGNAYEGNLGILLQELTIPGSLVLDIGAHIGVHTIPLSRKVGKEGAVIAFEPKRGLYRELRNNLFLNQCDNVLAIRKGVGDAFKVASIQGIQIQQDLEDKCDDLEEIDIIPIDSMNLKNVSLIKMDIEQYEYFAFQGAKETILRNMPVIIFECWINENKDNRSPEETQNFKRVMTLLESYGYEIYLFWGNDFVAFPKARHSEFLEYKQRYNRVDLDTF